MWVTAAVLIYAIAVAAAVDSVGAAEAASLATEAGVTPATVLAGERLTVTVAATSAITTIGLIDVEVYGPAGGKKSQQWFNDQVLAAGVPTEVSATWRVPPAWPAGRYTVKIGVFSPDWGRLDHWNDNAVQFVVTAADPSAPSTQAPTEAAAAAAPADATEPAIVPAATGAPAAPAAPAGRFTTLPPGATLPSGEACAGLVRRAPWEPRPENEVANHTPGGVIARIDGVDAEGNARLAPRVDGNFAGTTDEIIQWGACKWGFDEEIVRAVAVQESWWRQRTLGDWNGTTYESHGLLQVRAPVHQGTYPRSQTSTAFNVDYALAWRRSCYEGYFRHWVPAEAQGDEWGCVGLWFSGRWKDAAALGYVEQVQRWLADQVWLQPGF